MAVYYVYSAAAGTGTGADWTNASTKLRLAMTSKAAGDVFYVAHDHAETEAVAMTVTSPGTEALPCRVYCVNRAGSVPPVSADLRTTATISTTGASAITLAGTVSECYGIIFTAGSSTSFASILVGGTANRSWRLVNCSLRLGNSSSSSRIAVPSLAGCQQVVLENTTVQFGATGQTMQAHAKLVWRNTPSAILAGTIPTVLVTSNAGGAEVFMEGVDLSASTSGKNIINGATFFGRMTLKDCKLGSGVTVAIVPTTNPASNSVDLIRCDSGDTNYRTERINFMGSLTTETTIVRTGGASDGTTPISYKIVTTANSNSAVPFECFPISVWNETVGSPVTVTVEGIWGGGAVPLNDEIWIDVEYLGTSGFPIASRATSTKADGLATGANITAGSGTWGGSTTKFAMSATFTPQEKGPITIYVKVAKPSSTFYIDPKPIVT